VSRLHILGLALSIAAASAWSAPHTLAAKPGQFQARTLAAPSSKMTFSGTAKLLATASSPQWPAAVYIGIQEGPNRNNSVQVLAIRNRPTDDYLVVGYRLVVGGKEVKVHSIADVPLNSVLKVRIDFTEGLTMLHVNDARAIELATPFKQVAPYVSVSSGEAEFGVDP
jgi:hypothetical protein